jgi:hypothetical protein
VHWWVRLGLVMAVTGIAVAAARAGDDAKLDELIVLSGAAARLQHYRNGVENELARLPTAGSLSSAERHAYKAAFASDKLAATLRRQLAAQALAPADVDACLNFLKGSLAQRVAFGDIVATQEMRTRIPEAFAADQPVDRRRQLQEIDRLLDASQSSLEIVLAVNTAIARGLAGKPDADDAYLERLMDGFRRHLTRFTFTTIEPAVAHAFKDLATTELEDMRRALAAPSAVTVNRVIATALSRTLANAARELGEEIAASMKAHPP